MPLREMQTADVAVEFEKHNEYPYSYAACTLSDCFPGPSLEEMMMVWMMMTMMMMMMMMMMMLIVLGSSN